MRYITTNASNKIPFETQLMLWHLYDSMDQKVKVKDYFQVFDLFINPDGSQKIVHFREEPKWKEECTLVLNFDKAVNAKVYIIKDELEDGPIETFLLAEDY